MRHWGEAANGHSCCARACLQLAFIAVPLPSAPSVPHPLAAATLAHPCAHALCRKTGAVEYTLTIRSANTAPLEKFMKDKHKAASILETYVGRCELAKHGPRAREAAQRAQPNMKGGMIWDASPLGPGIQLLVTDW